MRIAIVHDWLYTSAGAERVLEQMIQVYPEADIFTLIDALPAERRGFLQGRPVQTSFLQRLPFAGTRHRSYLPLMPLAIEQFQLSEYDLILSSSCAVAKGVVRGPEQIHVCYCHSPMRYAWDLQEQYLRESRMDRGVKGFLARVLLHYMRIWDFSSSSRVDQFIANSSFVAKRIRKFYGANSEVLFPPVDVDKFLPQPQKEDYYVASSRMVPYKRVDLIVEAFSQMPDKRLVVIGDGPEMAKVRAKAGPNIQLMGFQEHDVLSHHLQQAKGYVFAAEEDFGIAPLEAQACGTPVLAFGRGGVTETIRAEGPEPTGHFFHRQNVESLIRGVTEFDARIPSMTSAACRENAMRFAPEAFRSGLRRIVRETMITDAALPG